MVSCVLPGGALDILLLIFQKLTRNFVPYTVKQNEQNHSSQNKAERESGTVFGPPAEIPSSPAFSSAVLDILRF